MDQQGSIFADVRQPLGNSERITHKSRRAFVESEPAKIPRKKDDKVANKTRYKKERHGKGIKRARNKDRKKIHKRKKTIRLLLWCNTFSVVPVLTDRY